jgi:hypothetical protein
MLVALEGRFTRGRSASNIATYGRNTAASSRRSIGEGIDHEKSSAGTGVAICSH